MINILFRIFPFLFTVLTLSILSLTKAEGLFDLDTLLENNFPLNAEEKISADMILLFCIMSWLLYVGFSRVVRPRIYPKKTLSEEI